MIKLLLSVLLLFVVCNGCLAYMSQMPNIVTSPVYAGLDCNIYHSILYPKNKNTKSKKKETNIKHAVYVHKK